MDRRPARRTRPRRAGAGLSTSCASEAAPAGKHRGPTEGTRTMSAPMDPQLAAGNRVELATYRAQHFGWSVEQRVGTITLARPERKNPLTFASYAELRDLFRRLAYATDVKCIVVTGAGGNFCSGGDVHDIIAPLTKMTMPELMRFTRMTGDLVKAMRACPQPIIAAVEGICAGAGAIIAMASDL